MPAVLISAAVGLAVTLLATPMAIRLYRLWGLGERIREDYPHSHQEKMGTPTMGGSVILFGLAAAYLATRVVFKSVTAAGLSLLLVAFGLGALGFFDDYRKARRPQSLGLSKRAKIVGQLLVAVAFGILTVRYADTSTDLSFIRDTGLNLGLFFYVWAFLMITAASNAVNLTDGLDGLASGSSILVLAAYIFIAFWQFRHPCSKIVAACYPVGLNASLDTAIVAAGAMGAVAGFLWWNAAPAQIFMGDTGSLALGGLLAALAITTRTQLLLVVLGGLFVLETTSVIAQVVSFRLFRRRVLRMAPIHHHFEVSGWPEFTVIVRFWIVAGLGVALGLGFFYADFIARGGA